MFAGTTKRRGVRESVHVVSRAAPEERSKIRTAMNSIESKTCLRFVDKNDSSVASRDALQDVGHAEHLYIVRERARGCYAMIGYHQDMGSPHTMNLESPPCLAHQGTIQHELLHVAGLLHEQARHDRDNAVVIYWENIDKSKCSTPNNKRVTRIFFFWRGRGI